MTNDPIIIATVGTCVATAVLAYLTMVLAVETKKMRKANDEIFRRNREPYLIIYPQFDHERLVFSLVLENISDNPAFNVNLSFEPDLHLNVHKNTEDNIRLSMMGLTQISVVAPRQKIRNDYTIINNGSGNIFAEDPKFAVDVEFSFTSRDRKEFRYIQQLNDRSLPNEYLFPKTEEAKQTEALTKISNAVVDMRDELKRR